MEEELVARSYPMQYADGDNGGNEQGKIDSFLFQRCIPLACVQMQEQYFNHGVETVAPVGNIFKE